MIVNPSSVVDPNWGRCLGLVAIIVEGKGNIDEGGGDCLADWIAAFVACSVELLLGNSIGCPLPSCGMD